jgi:thiol-disulfide isomerase/thioredoxin
MKSIFNNFLIIFLLFSCSKPDLNVFEGKGVFLDDLKGKWIVFNYWADWCPPCIKEIPELNSLQSNFSDDLKVFLINFDMLEGEELKQQLEKFNVQVDSLLTDPSIIYDWVIPENLPVTFIINRNGELEFTLVGPQTEEEIIKLLSL